MRYVPALDGLRALCVLAVLCFHAGFEWAGGGFLGVSTFFTLSGFLVTGLLFDEFDASGNGPATRPGAGSGRIDLGAFWQRRMRRLVPAAVVTLMGVTLAAPLFLGPEARVRLGADVIASLAYVVNWRFVEADYAYSLIFSAPSWVQHFWSLAIEGQLYLLLPVLAMFAGWSGSPGKTFGRVVFVLLVAGTGYSFLIGADASAHDRIYYGTDTRAPELFAGALLAMAMRRHPQETDRPHGGVALDWAGAIALLVVLACWNGLGLETPGLYRGGLAVYAALSVLLVASCIHGTLIPWLLAWAPLVWLGRVSYGVYLFHWPIYLALDAAFDEPAPWLRFVVGGGLTLGLAGLSSAWIETPIRRGQGPFGRRVGRSTAIAMITVVALVLIVYPAPRRGLLEELGMGSSEPAFLAEAEAEDEVRAGRSKPSVAVFGDSVALTFAQGFVKWLNISKRAPWVRGMVVQGCGLLLPAHLRAVQAGGGDITRWVDGSNRNYGESPACLDYMDSVRERVDSNRPGLAVVLMGTWDLAGLPGTWDLAGQPARGRPVLLPLGHPSVEPRMREAMDEFVEVLSFRGAKIAWLTLPRFKTGKRFMMMPGDAEAARIRFNELIRELPERWPGRVHVIDLAAHVDAWPAGPFDPALREDGLHFTKEVGFEFVASGVGEEILALLEERSEEEREQGR